MRLTKGWKILSGFGLFSWFVMICAVTGQTSVGTEQSKKPESSAFLPVNADVMFARIKQLAGRWRTRSTKGWTGGDTIRVIARGSALIFESEFDDNTDAGMATLYYLDNGRLLLTHYCEAGNQPTLVATGQSPDGKVLAFTFLSGTGMKSRDEGHMDKVVFRFADADSYTSQWTWYKAGSEKWLEEIEYHRANVQSGRKR